MSVFYKSPQGFRFQIPNVQVTMKDDDARQLVLNVLTFAQITTDKIPDDTLEWLGIDQPPTAKTPAEIATEILGSSDDTYAHRDLIAAVKAARA